MFYLYGTSGPVKYKVLPWATELDIYMVYFRPKKLQSQIFFGQMSSLDLGEEGGQ